MVLAAAALVAPEPVAMVALELQMKVMQAATLREPELLTVPVVAVQARWANLPAAVTAVMALVRPLLDQRLLAEVAVVAVATMLLAQAAQVVVGTAPHLAQRGLELQTPEAVAVVLFTLAAVAQRGLVVLE